MENVSEATHEVHSDPVWDQRTYITETLEFDAILLSQFTADDSSHIFTDEDGIKHLQATWRPFLN